MSYALYRDAHKSCALDSEIRIEMTTVGRLIPRLYKVSPRVDFAHPKNPRGVTTMIWFGASFLRIFTIFEGVSRY
jgi:hypothetical protein